MTINPDNIQYIVNEEKRTVVAIVAGVEYDAYRQISVNLPLQVRYNAYIPSELILPHTIKSVAHCNPADEWDETIGKRAARRKLYRKYNRLKANAVRKFRKNLEKLCSELADMQSYLEVNAAKPLNIYNNEKKQKKCSSKIRNNGKLERLAKKKEKSLEDMLEMGRIVCLPIEDGGVPVRKRSTVLSECIGCSTRHALDIIALSQYAGKELIKKVENGKIGYRTAASVAKKYQNDDKAQSEAVLMKHD